MLSQQRDDEALQYSLTRSHRKMSFDSKSGLARLFLLRFHRPNIESLH